MSVGTHEQCAPCPAAGISAGTHEHKVSRHNAQVHEIFGSLTSRARTEKKSGFVCKRHKLPWPEQAARSWPPALAENKGPEVDLALRTDVHGCSTLMYQTERNREGGGGGGGTARRVRSQIRTNTARHTDRHTGQVPYEQLNGAVKTPHGTHI